MPAIISMTRVSAVQISASAEGGRGCRATAPAGAKENWEDENSADGLGWVTVSARWTARSAALMEILVRLLAA